MITIKPSIVGSSVRVVKNNHSRGGSESLIGTIGIITEYTNDAKQNIRVRYGDENGGWMIWFDADELEEVKPVIVEEKQ